LHLKINGFQGGYDDRQRNDHAGQLAAFAAIADAFDFALAIAIRTTALVGILHGHLMAVLRGVRTAGRMGILVGLAMTVMHCRRGRSPRSDASDQRGRNRRDGDGKGDQSRQDCSIANHQRPTVGRRFMWARVSAQSTQTS
jgi:hypothetical protein